MSSQLELSYIVEGMPGPESDRLVLERIVESVPNGIVYVAPGGAIRLANEEAQAFLGLSFDDLTKRYTVDFEGKTYFEDGTPCSVDAYPVTRCLVTGERQGPTTIGVEQPTGELRHAIFTATPVAMDEGVGAVVTFVDITGRKAEEAERERMRLQLVQSERLAALGTLAAGVAHEINNPLTYLLGNLDLLRDALSAERPELLDMTDRAMDGARRVTRIVRQLRRFTRSGAEQPDESFSASASVNAALELARPHLRNAAAVVVEIPQDVPLRGREASAVQILINLILNAAQSAPRPRIELRARQEGDRAVIEVIDDGAGMDEESLARAFDAFYTTKAAGTGSGLGLVISRDEAARMGGELVLTSSPGHGTTARLSLRIAEAPVQRPAVEFSRLPPGHDVLVIDDEPEIIEFVARCLEDQHLVTCSRAADALARLEGQSFDLILCDLVMPGMTGMDLHDEVRRRWPQLRSKTVFMTGGGYTERARGFIESFEGEVLVKPFTREQLRTAAIAAISGQSPTSRPSS